MMESHSSNMICLLAPEGKEKDSEERNHFSINACTAAEESAENLKISLKDVRSYYRFPVPNLEIGSPS